MSGNDPALSVIIPVWNGERYLAEAIDSVLDQHAAPPLEVIVVDDGSEDDSAAVAERFGPSVRCLRRAHRGLAAARNSGVDAARGEFLLHLDADDLLTPDSIATRMAAMDGADIVVGRMLSFVSPDLEAMLATRYRVPAGPQRGGLPGTSLIRTAFATRVGGFDPDRATSPDLDWMARATSAGARIVDVANVVLHRRIHDRNMSLTANSADRLAIVRAALQRRRSAES